MTDKLVEWYQKASTKLTREDTAWYAQPWFVGLALVAGLSVGVYLWYLKRRVSRLKAKNKLQKHKHAKAKRDARLAAHAVERKQLKHKAKKAGEERRRIGRKLNHMQKAREQIEESIDEVSTVEGLRRKQDHIEQNSGQ